MPKYLDSAGVSYLWNKLKNIQKTNLTYQSKTTAEWNNTPFLESEANVLYIYSDYKIKTDDYGQEYYIPGLKIGDGKAYLIDLPFVNNVDSDLENMLLDHVNNKIIHVDLVDRGFWDNKVNAQLQNENLILTNM